MEPTPKTLEVNLATAEKQNQIITKVDETINKVGTVESNMIKSINGTSPDTSGNLNIDLKQTPIDPSSAPGPKKAIGEPEIVEFAFFGEVASVDLISGDDLASVLGLTSGVSQHSDAGWLKFIYKNKVEFVAKKTFRHSISWDSINAVNAVYGDKTVNIKGLTYKVRLMRGVGEDIQPDPKVLQSKTDGEANHNSEWNALMLPIHANAPSSWYAPDNVKSPVINLGVNYTDKDLITHNTAGNGSYSWCQETAGGSASHRVLRGYYGVSCSGAGTSSYASAGCGWRPVLELVG